MVFQAVYFCLLAFAVATLGRPTEVTGSVSEYTTKVISRDGSSCQRHIKLDSLSAGTLVLNSRPKQCTTTLTAPDGMKISLRTIRQDIYNEDQLEISNGDTADLGTVVFLSGFDSSNSKFASEGSQVTLKFVTSSHKPTKTHTGFTLLYTVFIDGTCPSNQPGELYQCANDHCVDRSLICDYYDNCHDFSDEESPDLDCAAIREKRERRHSGNSPVMVALVVVVGILLVTLCVTGAVLWKRHMRETRAGAATTTSGAGRGPRADMYVTKATAPTLTFDNPMMAHGDLATVCGGRYRPPSAGTD